VRVQSLSSARSALGASLLVIAGVQYLVLEFVAAAAWRHPAYNYAVDFISDLGNPVRGDVFEGRVIDSPLNVVMDVAFIAQGVLFVAAAVLLYRFAGHRLGTALLVLATMHGVGVILVGFFHESSAALTNGVIVVHSIGAATTIVAGNAIALVLASTGARLGLPRAYRVASLVLGVLGLLAFVVLQVDRPLYDTVGGIPERVAVYTILAGEIVTGASVLALGRVRRSGTVGVAA
jgi:hypothetical membrane protein